LIHIMVNCCLDLSGAQNITRNSVLWRSAASCGVLRSLDGPTSSAFFAWFGSKPNDRQRRSHKCDNSRLDYFLTGLSACLSWNHENGSGKLDINNFK